VLGPGGRRGRRAKRAGRGGEAAALKTKRKSSLEAVATLSPGTTNTGLDRICSTLDLPMTVEIETQA
jgi:hypothetical protein